jgi:hypothetical protein
MHLTVAWLVNVAAAINFQGSGAPIFATTTVIAIVLYVIMMTFY